MSRRAKYIAYAVLALSPLIALVPLVRVAVDWATITRVAPVAGFQAVERGYDWVEWVERDGLIHADFVLPQGPAAEAGLRQGDVFHELDYQQYFTVDDLQQAIRGVQPGTRAVYTVMRGEETLQIEVPFSRAPTFLYPLSRALWQFSLWGFAIGAFLHILGLRIVTPLSLRSRKARFSLVLISVSSLWIIGNLLRLALIELLGPPIAVGAFYDSAFQVITLLGLAGWLAFPTLLLHKVVLDARLLRSGTPRLTLIPLYTPAVLLAAAALTATLEGSVGPLTLNGLATYILFYACTYIASAAALMFAIYLARPDRAEEVLGRWNRTGSIVTLVLSVAAALAVVGMVSVLPTVSDLAAGWLIVNAQLLSVAPVVLVSHATLQHGKVDLVVSRGIVYLALLGLFFFAFVAGTALLEPYAVSTGASRHVLSGLFVIALLLVFGRLARGVDVYAASLLASDRRRARRVAGGFATRMRTLLDPDSLARESAHTLARAFDARFAAVCLRPDGDGGPSVLGSCHPEPPFVTERFVSLVWAHLRSSSDVWAPNNELGGDPMPAEIAGLLNARGVALAVPIWNEDGPSGLILLGEKRHRRAVYNLEDVDLARSFAAQLTLAMERLALVEREKALVRESAEAHLVALRAQINPHFLFNALNTIASLISEQPREAEQTVERVAAIFRHTLQAGSRPFVPLKDELDLVSQYLYIEKARFGKKLEVAVACEEGLNDHPVPAFCLQTLVENAVKHGLEGSRIGGTVRITCRSRADHVELSVFDSGAGIPQLFGTTRTESFYGVGLKNVAARLQMLYGTDGRMSITSHPDHGTTASITIPRSGAASTVSGADVGEKRSEVTPAIYTDD